MQGSFDALERWVKELDKANSHGHEVKMVLVGNKNDLYEKRVVTPTQGDVSTVLCI